MKKLLLVVTLVLVPFALSAQDSRPTSKPAKKADWAPREDCSGSYGAGLSKAKIEPVSVSMLVESIAKHEGKTVRVKGVIESACQKKGCWIVVVEGKQQMRVRFKDYKFFVPTNAAGYEAVIEGTAKAVTISEKEAKHYAEDAGDKEAAAKIKGPQKGVAFTATGLTLTKVTKK